MEWGKKNQTHFGLHSSIAYKYIINTIEPKLLIDFRYNVSGSNRLSLDELKVMMEKMGAPQTHLSLKSMIQEVDEDGDGAISFREFLLIFRKAAAGELKEDSGLSVLAKQCEVDVHEVGVGGAKTFFEAKVRSIEQS